MHATCVVIVEEGGEELEIGSFLYKQSNSARDPKRKLTFSIQVHKLEVKLLG